MFDRATCPDQARLTGMPSVSLTAFSALVRLLRQASSSAPHPDLPAATRAVLTSLMTALILGHAETRPSGPVAGAGHDL